MNFIKENFMDDELYYDNNKYIDYLINNIKINLIDNIKENKNIIEENIYLNEKYFDLNLHSEYLIDLDKKIPNKIVIHQNNLIKSYSTNYIDNNSKHTIKKNKIKNNNKKNIPIKNFDLVINKNNIKFKD